MMRNQTQQLSDLQPIIGGVSIYQIIKAPYANASTLAIYDANDSSQQEIAVSFECAKIF
jgi:hypothetical protein